MRLGRPRRALGRRRRRRLHRLGRRRCNPLVLPLGLPLGLVLQPGGHLDARRALLRRPQRARGMQRFQALLDAAEHLLEHRPDEEVSLAAIAAHAGISQRRLERLFRRFIGRTPARYYRDVRLDRARGLATQTDLPLREIALACGFASPEHFSRAYRKRFGAPPQVDRQAGRVPFEFRAWPMHERGGLN